MNKIDLHVLKNRKGHFQQNLIITWILLRKNIIRDRMCLGILRVLKRSINRFNLKQWYYWIIIVKGYNLDFHIERYIEWHF